MAKTEGGGDGGYLIWPGGKDPALSYGSLELRRRIAASLAARQRGFPKNLGEGLTYFGESLGEAGLMWRLEQAERARDAKLAAEAQKLYPAEPEPEPRPTTAPVTTAPPPTAAPPAAAAPAAPVAAAPPQAEPWVVADRFDASQGGGDQPDIGPAAFTTRFDAVAGAAPEPAPVAAPAGRPVVTTSFRPPAGPADLASPEPPPEADPYLPPAPSPSALNARAAGLVAPQQGPLDPEPYDQRKLITPGGPPDPAVALAPKPGDWQPTVPQTADMRMPRPRPSGDLPAQAAMTPRGAPGGNVQSWYNFATRPREEGGLGLSHAQAAAKVANLQAESGPGIKPWGVAGDSGTAFGAAQWRGPRFAALQRFASERGMDHRTTEAQQAFMRHEYDTTEKRAYQKLLAAQTPEAAATAINRYYERSAERTGGRERNAARLAGMLGPGDGNASVATAAPPEADPAAVMGGPARMAEADPLETPDMRDAIAAAIMQQPQQQQAGPSEEDVAGEARMRDVIGMSRPGSPFLATATASRGDIGSDAPMPGLSPLGSATGAGIADTAKQRQQIYNAVQQQQQGPAVPPVDPTLAATTSPQSSPTGTGSNPVTVTDIAPAPIGRPGQAVAQAGPGVAPVAPVPPIVAGPPTTPYAGKPLVEPTAPVRPPMGKEETAAYRLKATNPGDPDVARLADTVIAREQKKRDDAYARDIEVYKSRMTLHNKLAEEQEKARLEGGKRAADEAKTWEEVRKARDDAGMKERLGGRDPDKFFAEMDKSKVEAQQIVHQLNMNRMAIKAINEGVVTGWGANFRIDVKRLEAFALNNGMAGDAAANTQVLRASLSAAIGQAVRNIQGGSTAQVSNTDRQLAEKASGADPTLEPAAIRQLLNTSNRLASDKLNDFEDRRDYYLKGTRAHRDFQLPSTETAPQPFVDKLVSEPTPENKRAFDARFGEGSAELEIGRYKRRNR